MIKALAQKTRTNHPIRIQSLDGLRGLAILFVLCFHSFVHWHSSLSWAGAFKDILFFKYGFLGVQLFFLISGYVIYMTLESCLSYKEFLLRRWLRLFPAMLIATLLIFITSYFLPERPGRIDLIDLVPGLLFIEPDILEILLNIPKIHMLEETFWTLFIEVKYYVIFGLLYFLVPKHALTLFTFAFFSYFCIFFIDYSYENYHLKSLFSEINLWTSINHYGWFAAGAWLYRALKEKQNRFILYATLLLPANLWMVESARMTLEAAYFGLSLYCIFILGISYPKVINFFSHRFWVFFGFISYPLYLIHEQAIVTLSIKTHQIFPDIPDVLTIFPAIILIVLIAYFIAEWCEPLLRNSLKVFIGVKK